MTKRIVPVRAICPPDTLQYLAFMNDLHGEFCPLPTYRQLGVGMYAVGRYCGRPHEFDYEAWENISEQGNREARRAQVNAPEKKRLEHEYLDGKDMRRDLYNESVELVKTVLDREGSYAGTKDANSIALALNDAGHFHVMPAHVRAAKAGR